MKATHVFAFLFSLFYTSSFLQARERNSENLGEVDTVWQGIRYEIFRIERMPNDRLIVGLRVIATPSAPAAGTLIGVRVPIPANATTQETFSGRYTPLPLSLDSSQMIDEQTQQKYPALSPVALAGMSVLPSVTLATLRPGQAENLSVQFAAPPPTSREPGKQTVSFLFPSAKGPISRVPIPPLEAQ